MGLARVFPYRGAVETDDGTGTPAHERDSVDEILGAWALQRTELDFSPVGIVTRLERVRAYLDAALAEVFDGFGLTPADFVVVVALRRAGAPYRLPQTRLMTTLGLTSGTVSVRLARLETRGIVRREEVPDDRRVQAVRLTDEGLRLFDRIAPIHLTGEDRLLSALGPDERERLTCLLRTLLASYEQQGDQAPWLWGMRLEPVHVARRRRAEVGLPDVPGLLVSATCPGAPAQRCGVTRGDLITHAGGGPVRTVEGLARAAGETGTVALTLLRGESTAQVVLRLGDDGP